MKVCPDGRLENRRGRVGILRGRGIFGAKVRPRDPVALDRDHEPGTESIPIRSSGSLLSTTAPEHGQPYGGHSGTEPAPREAERHQAHLAGARPPWQARGAAG